MRSRLFRAVIVVGSGLFAGGCSKDQPAPADQPKAADAAPAPDARPAAPADAAPAPPDAAPSPPDAGVAPKKVKRRPAPVLKPVERIAPPPPPPRIHAVTPEKMGQPRIPEPTK